MPIVTRHSMITVVVLAIAALLVTGIFIWSGIYNIGADNAHTKPVYSVLHMLRDRSIAARAKKLHPPPNLNDATLIRQGAGNYDAMCTSCHLGPDMEETEISKGLYPAPPNFAEVEVGDPAHHFWVIKHGIKASGMPAWGKSMQDEYIWGMVAFLQQLPKLDGEQYLAIVASSGGHSHGGGETLPMPDDHGDMPMEGTSLRKTKPNAHPSGTPSDHHETATPPVPTQQPATASVEHRHADGTIESHPVPQPAKADDGHNHEH